MELADLARRARPRTWILAVVLGVASALLVIFALLAPRSYQLTATVGVTSPTGTDTAATLSQSVDSFRSALLSDGVRAAAATDAGLARPIPAPSITTSRVGASNLVDIELSSRRKDLIQEVLQDLVAQANDVVYLPLMNAATADTAAAQANVDTIRAATEKTIPGGLITADEQYRAKSGEVTQLRIAIATAKARGEGTGSLQDSLDDANGELTKLTQTLLQLEPLQQDYNRALGRLADAKNKLDQLTAHRTAAMAPTSIKLGDTTTTSRRVILVRAVVTGLIIGLGVAVGLALLFEALRHREPAAKGTRKATAQPAEGAS